MTTGGYQQEYWDNRYLQGDTGWDLGAVSPPLKAYMDQLRNPAMSILIPGCGNAWEAEYLLQKGFMNITVVDISPTLIAGLEEKFSGQSGKWLHLICGDFFALEGEYDLILEQTFFCALEPACRQAYAEKMHSLLKSGGKLAGLLFNKTFEQSPPYGGSMEEYKSLFFGHFHLRKMELCGNSVTPRANSELFFIAEKP
jgi:cyclopropane fatty-acyl-phospholipid synthase-like methyltransferase